ncbi:YdgH/BhsA/McbA-like domain containing protein, partial [Enterobacteriaceae bacterium LUAb1]
QAQEINRAQSLTLQKIGSVSAIAHGSPDDAQRAIADKANAAGAPYYLILMLDDNLSSGMWRAQASLFAPLPVTASTQQ